MIKPFEILREDVCEDGTLVLYKVTKSSMTEINRMSRKSVTSTIFVLDGLDIEAELVKNLREGGWL